MTTTSEVPRFFISDSDLPAQGAHERTSSDLYTINDAALPAYPPLALARHPKLFETPATFWDHFLFKSPHQVDVHPRAGVFPPEEECLAAPSIRGQILGLIRFHRRYNNRLIVSTHVTTTSDADLFTLNSDSGVLDVSVLGYEERTAPYRPYLVLVTATAETIHKGTKLRTIDALVGNWTVVSIWSHDWWWATLELLEETQRRRVMVQVSHQRVQGHMSYPHVVGRLIQQESARGLEKVKRGLKKLFHHGE
uniref:Uncharacterized protein n=1 Tax=Mycena chlorophos TaxID=658473 RepID=A0ABQ0LAT0_MYCCL|nr:predicted protein [Mycena chlorophos]